MEEVKVPAAKSSPPAAVEDPKAGDKKQEQHEMAEASQVQDKKEVKAIASESSDDEILDGIRAMFEESDPQDPSASLLSKAEQSDRERDNAFLLLLFVLLAIGSPVVVWRSSGQPLLLVWRISLLLCSSAWIWTQMLRAPMRAQTLLVCTAFGFLTALYVDAALGPKFGVLVAHLNSHVAVGILGYALAERRQRGSNKVSADDIIMPANQEEADRLLDLQVLGCCYTIVITLGMGGYVAWVLYYMIHYSIEQLVMLIFLPVSGVLVFWICFVTAMLLRGAFISETGHSFLVMYFMSATLLYAMGFAMLGGLGAMLITWFVILGLSGFFGYTIGIYASVNLKPRVVEESEQSIIKSPSTSLLGTPDVSIEQSPPGSEPSTSSASPPSTEVSSWESNGFVSFRFSSPLR